MFGIPVVSFNLAGKMKVKSNIGFIVTILVVWVMTLFAVAKFDKLLQRKNPLLTQAILEDFHDGMDIRLKINSKSTDPHCNFRLAFGVVGYYDRWARDDPDYVKWEIKLHSVINETKSIKHLSFHKCTPEDYDLFYKPKPRIKKTIDRLRKN